MPPIISVALLIGAVGVIAWLTYSILQLRHRNRELQTRFVEIDQIKKDFISHVSHELKAPLASMQETTQLLLERIPGPLTEKQQRLLELNLQSGKHLAQMIGNILDLSKLEAGVVQFEMQTSDVADLVYNVVIELTHEARENSLRVLTDIQREPLYVECDPNRMVQLFTNLLENAIRFSAKGGIVKVQARSHGKHALIAISDSGPGIEDEHKETVFRTFHQVKQGKKSRGESLGLGLAISRRLVEAHAGRIWVEDNPGGGSIFSVQLPRSSAEIAA
ncbi:MAG: HAMP domain-containing histidine kinase [Acidobacteria bacterium]|nr:HAMP domain-containing histidine kinase [Acidobacteriota bacterium]